MVGMYKWELFNRKFIDKLTTKDKINLVKNLGLFHIIRLSRKEIDCAAELINLYFEHLSPKISSTRIFDIEQGIEETKKSQCKI